MNELKFKDYASYRADVHTNHKKLYTTSELEIITSDMPIADIAVALGRTCRAIVKMRNKIKKEKNNGI